MSRSPHILGLDSHGRPNPGVHHARAHLVDNAVAQVRAGVAVGPANGGVAPSAPSSDYPKQLDDKSAWEIVSLYPEHGRIVTGHFLGDVVRGSEWVALDGKRFVFGVVEASVVYYQKSHFYYQTRAGFVSDVIYCPLITGARRAAVGVTIVTLEMKLILGILAGASWIGFGLVIGMETVEFLNEHRKQIPGWIDAYKMIKEGRRIMKEKFPTLYDELYRAVFSKFYGDVWNRFGEAATPEVIMFFIGVVIGDIASHMRKHGAISPGRIMFILLLCSVMRIGASIVPGAISLTIDAYKAQAEELIKRLKECGITIDIPTARKIIDEIRQHPNEMKQALEKLRDGFTVLENALKEQK